MLRTLQIIYERLHIHPLPGSSLKSSLSLLESEQAVRFLSEKCKYDYQNNLYPDLIKKIKLLKQKYVPEEFVERFCLAQLTDNLINEYSLNILEAFVLGYIGLNRLAELNLVYFKLGASKLISIPATINGSKILDPEVVANLVVKSLIDKQLIKLTENRYLVGGKNLHLDY